MRNPKKRTECSLWPVSVFASCHIVNDNRISCKRHKSNNRRKRMQRIQNTRRQKRRHDISWNQMNSRLLAQKTFDEYLFVTTTKTSTKRRRRKIQFSKRMKMRMKFVYVAIFYPKIKWKYIYQIEAKAKRKIARTQFIEIYSFSPWSNRNIIEITVERIKMCQQTKK